MSSEHNSHNSHSGSVGSYVTGFILSLIFTAIPYYMVVNKTVSGNALLVTILGFAVLQMLVQIFFFLHLGRGPKPLYNVVFFVSTVGIILVVVGGSILIINNLHYMTPEATVKKLSQDENISQVGGQKTGACQGRGVNHKFTISSNSVGPGSIRAKLCDTLTFINQEDTEREITFAAYPKQGTYAGETNLKPTSIRSKTINLNQTGTYQFYDRRNPSVTGSFTVSE